MRGCNLRAVLANRHRNARLLHELGEATLDQIRTRNFVARIAANQRQRPDRHATDAREIDMHASIIRGQGDGEYIYLDMKVFYNTLVLEFGRDCRFEKKKKWSIH